MKNIVTALIAASILGLVAVPVSALDARSFYEQQERTAGGA